MRSCPVTQCHHNEEGLCREPSCPLWTLYREVTGKCDICNLPMNEHPKCDGCGILTGRGHEDFSSNYRGHELCGHCINRWQALDENAGRETTWGEFLRPELLFAFPRLGEGYYVKGQNEPVGDEEPLEELMG